MGAETNAYLAGYMSKTAEDIADILSRFVAEHRIKPGYTGNSSIIPRSLLPVSLLSTKDLRALGFTPSYIAVPEINQTEFTTYRHPKNNLHFHRHGANWIFHEDAYPSLAMVVKKHKDKTGSPLLKTILTKKKEIADGVLHGVVEGVPGYASWISHMLSGHASFADHILRPQEQRRLLRRTIFNTAARTSLLGAMGTVVAGPDVGGTLTGGGVGLVSGTSIGNALRTRFPIHNVRTIKGALLNLLFGAAVPLTAMTTGAKAGNVLGKATEAYIGKASQGISKELR
jgi:hypothetical protein